MWSGSPQNETAEAAKQQRVTSRLAAADNAQQQCLLRVSPSQLTATGSSPAADPTHVINRTHAGNQPQTHQNPENPSTHHNPLHPAHHPPPLTTAPPNGSLQVMLRVATPGNSQLPSSYLRSYACEAGSTLLISSAPCNPQSPMSNG